VQLHEVAMASCLLLKYRWKLGGKNPGKGLAQKRKSRKKGNFRSVVWAGGDMPKRGKERGCWGLLPPNSRWHLSGAGITNSNVTLCQNTSCGIKFNVNWAPA